MYIIDVIIIDKQWHVLLVDTVDSRIFVISITIVPCYESKEIENKVIDHFNSLTQSVVRRGRQPVGMCMKICACSNKMPRGITEVWLANAS